MAEHAARIGREAGEEAERLDRLEDSHAAAVEGPAAEAAGGADQFGVDGEVHDVGHPEPRLQQSGGQGQAGVRRHPGRGGVDQAIGAGQHRGERTGFSAPGPARTEPVTLTIAGMSITLYSRFQKTEERRKARGLPPLG